MRIRLAAAIILLLLPGAANASWENSGEIVRGTAQVLEKGEIAVGVFAPLQFGLTDTVTAQSHPILDLLQLINLSLRWRVAAGQTWIAGLTGGFKYALLNDDRAVRTFEFDGGAIFSWFPHRTVAATLGLTYAPVVSDRGNGEGWHQAIAPHLTVHVIAHEQHMIMATMRSRLELDGGSNTSTLTAAWVSNHNFFGSVDVVLGVTFGDFAIRDPVVFTGNATCDTVTVPKRCTSNTSFYPVFDLWWRF